jgi:Xaa-Pro aminopeptidase
MIRDFRSLLRRCAPIVAFVAVLGADTQAQSLAPAPDPIPELPGMGRPIEIDATRARREALARRTGPGMIAVPAATVRDLERDVLQDNDFRQDDYFFYLTGLESPDAWLLIAVDASGSAMTHLFLPERNPGMEQWTGKKLGPGPDAARLTGIINVHPLDSLDRALRQLRRQAPGPLFTLLHLGSADNTRISQWVNAGSGMDVRNVVPMMDSLRLVKDDAEMVRLRRAIDITIEAQRAAMQRVEAGMYEYQIEATIEYTFRSLGADRVGFPSIIGSGPNSTTLHYDANRRQTRPGDLVVMDVGAEYGQYSADVTRTIPVDGRFTERQKAIYQLVLGAQQAAIDATRPGVTIGELTRIAQTYIERNGGNLCGGGSCNRYFIHGLSHWLGMRVHDVGDYSTPLAPGMVITIEPGIYIAGEQLGVRVEDDVLVTETGAEVLSAGAPRTVEDIEALMARRLTPQVVVP